MVIVQHSEMLEKYPKIWIDIWEYPETGKMVKNG